MAIEPNPRPETSEEDREVLRKVYQAQMDAYRVDHVKATKRLEAARRAYDASLEEHTEALRDEARIAGKIDALRMLAARDGVTLD